MHQRYARGEVLNEKLSKANLDHKRAFKTSGGKTVFGGGGIMPDIYIPLDTSAYTPMYRELYATGTINEYVYSTLVRTIKPTSLNSFITQYSLTNSQFEQLMALARAKNINTSAREIALSKGEIEKGIKAILAQYFYGDEGYFRVVNSSDQVVTKALSILK